MLTNQQNWVAVQTSQQAGTLTAAVINFQSGDTGKWHTADDNKLLNDAGISGQGNIAAVALNDHFLYVGTQGAIVRVDSNGLDKANILSFSSLGSPNSTLPLSIAVTNSPSGYPMYFVVDTNRGSHSPTGLLYKYNGTSANLIPAHLELMESLMYIQA